MRKIHILLSILISIFLFSCSEDDKIQDINTNNSNDETLFISQDEAVEIAQRFLENQDIFTTKTKASSMNLNLVYTDSSDQTMTKSKTQPTYYVININEDGYVIVAADKRALPVLAYSTESSFDPNSIPVNMKDILIDYRSEINYARVNGVKNLREVAKVREDILNGKRVETRATDQNPIQPLLGNIKWDQSPYYNDYCPPSTPVGCVATAQSQIMYYWKYPNQSEGTYSYSHPRYGRLSYDYNRMINWNAMQPNVLRRSNEEIASFCYGVAVSLDMSFDTFYNGGSYTYQDYVPRSLKRFYKYSSDVRNIRRDRYDTNQWMQMLYDELAAGRPVQYAGSGNGGGHSFVCDGYSRDGYFHFNWGWGGSSDGYFLLHALNPGSLGDGGGSGGYNWGQQAVIGFKPDGNVDPTPNPVETVGTTTGLQARNITSSKADLSWYTTDGAKKYIVDIRERYTYSWTSFESTTTNFTISNLDAETTYEWRVRGKGVNKLGDYSSTKSFKTLQESVEPNPTPIGEYCISKSNSTEVGYIRKVSIGNITNYSYDSAEGYEDFTYKSIYSTAGSRLSYTFTPAFSGYSQTAYWCAWIDYNKDGEFESNERIARESGRYSSYGSVYLPSNLARGEYRVRISMKLGNYPSTPCEVFESGEVEDYTLIIR